MPPTSTTGPIEAYRGNAPYVFVSYSHEDRVAVDAELIRLNNLGFNVWYDEGISPGSQWTDELAERITNCMFFLYFVTPRSVASRNCQDEANFVFEAGNPFLAVHLEETELPLGLKLRMGSRQAILKYKLDSASYERKLHAAIAARSSGKAADDRNLRLGFRLGDFDIEPLGGMLTPVDGSPRHLEPKVMDVLVMLAGHANEIVTREQLLDAVWTGQVAADELLTRAVSELRRAFGDHRGDLKYILTVPKRGYRLLGEVVPHSAEPEKTDAVIEAKSPTPMRKRAYLAIGSVALVVAYFAVDRIDIFPSQSVGSDLTETTGAVNGPTPNVAATAVRPRPLTSMEGFEYQAALSPDGNYVAFTWLGRFLTRRGVVYVMPVDGGIPIRLTDSKDSEQFPAWSPDGTRIAFIREKKQGGRDILVKPLLGGFETRVATFDGFAIELDWSTDGKSLAFSGGKSEAGPHQIFLVATDNGEIRAFTEREDGLSDVRPKFSPDGKSLAFLQLGGSAGGANICLLDLERSERRCITPEDKLWLIQDFDWTPDSEAIVAVVGGLSGLSVLTRISVATGIYTELPYGDGAMDVSIARFGGRLVFERLFQDHNLWRTAGPKAVAPVEPSKLIASTWDELAPEYSPDGTKIAFISARTGSWEVWIADADGSNPRQLTNRGFAAFPSWSPDGTRIAFSTGKYEDSNDAESGSGDGFKVNETFVVDASGGIPRLLSGDRHGAKNPSWSADGRGIYFESDKEDCGWKVWRRNVDTGEEVELARCASGPVEGPDRRVYFIDNENETINSVTIEGNDIRTELVTPAGCRFYYEGYTFWERNLVYIDCEDLKIRALDLDTREIRELASVYEKDQVSLALGLDVSPDGQWIVYNQLDRAGSDLMLVEPFQ